MVRGGGVVRGGVVREGECGEGRGSVVREW